MCSSLSFETQPGFEIPEHISQPGIKNTYEIVSKVAYLIGVSRREFTENTFSSGEKKAFYDELDKNKNARIIRHLCIIRNSIEKNYKKINNITKFEFRTIINMPECIPAESVNQLSQDGISFYKQSNKLLYEHIIEINKIISDRINNCKDIFPLWLNFNYIKDLFIMPNGLKQKGTADAAELFYANMSLYPYRMYINWKPIDVGNILYNDSKFVKILYDINSDKFTDTSKVQDVDSSVKGNIYDFISDGEKICIIVDCENSNPYKLLTTLKSLDFDYINKISKIILVDDNNTTHVWGFLEEYLPIPVEYILTNRIKENKSLVDISLTAKACKEYYEGNIDSFIIFSSDSDYWGLISSLDNARFLVMAEKDKCGFSMENTLRKTGIYYCYIDDFYSGDNQEMYNILISELRKYLKKIFPINFKNLLNEVLTSTRINMSESEKKQFYQKYIKTIYLDIEDNGDGVLRINKN